MSCSIQLYQNFVLLVVETLIPLHKLLCKVMSSQQILSWTEDAINVFEKCKNTLTSSALLAYPVMHGKLHSVCDASEKAIGSCFNQFDPKTQTWPPLAYYSKALTSSQHRYSTYDRELLALFVSRAISLIFCLVEMSP